MDFFENEGIGLKMLVFAGSSQLLSQLGRAIDRDLGSEVRESPMQSAESPVQSAECRVSSAECRVSSAECKVSSAECSGLGVVMDAERIRAVSRPGKNSKNLEI